MKLVKLGIICLITVISSLDSLCQKTLSNTEIRENWTKNLPVTSNLVEDDSVLSNRINGIIDSLKIAGIDTIGVFVSYVSGLISNNACAKNGESAFMFWREKNSIIRMRVSGNCTFNPQKLNASSFFSFYHDNKIKIDQELIMPVIYRGEIDSDGRIKLFYSISFHEPKYIIYLKAKDSIKFIRFAESSVSDARSVFYKENIAGETYKWFNLIVREVGNVNNVLE
jgi:hypothetical protein